MIENPFRWIIICIFLALISISLISIPVGALDLSSASASSGPPTIANGDSVFIHGIATGHPQNGLQLWIISHNYLKVTSIAVNDDNTYLYELKPADTQNLASGEYFFVVQHPMMNGQFDVVYDPSTGKIINKQLDGGNGMEIFTISGAGSLQGPDSAQALVNAISSQNIDDTFAPYSFYISPPTALINPIGDHYVGDKFTISGSTNLAAGDELMVEVASSSFTPTEKARSEEFSGASGVVKVVPGNGGGFNRWSFDVDATAFKPDEYIVKVSGITQDITGSTFFNIVNGAPAGFPATTLITLYTTVVPTTTLMPLTPLTITTTAKSPLPWWIAIGVLVVMVWKRKRN